MTVKQEIWREIPGFEGYYSISDHGGVRAEKREVSGKLGSLRTLPQRPMNPTFNSGYLQISLRKNGQHLTRKIHTLVMLAFVGIKPEGMEVAHFDGVRTNNHLGNLRYDTRQGNVDDRARHGTNRRGQESSRSALTEDQVLKIRLDSRPQRTIAKEYGVGHNAIGQIHRGTSWGWL